MTDQPIGFTLTYRGRSPEGLSSLNCVNRTKPGHSRQAVQAFLCYKGIVMGINVQREKVPEGSELSHMDEYLFNNGEFFANCEWGNRDNRDCYYLKKGCTGCMIKAGRKEVVISKTYM